MRLHSRLCYSGTEPWNKCVCKIDNPKTYKCKVCKRVYGLKNGLDIHLAIEKKKPHFHINQEKED